jgi:hypothetical protein
MISFLISLAHKVFLALEQSGKARANRYLQLHKRGMGGWV